MTDIVERLRDCFYLDDDDWQKLGNEAADRIEELEKALGEWSGGYQTLERENAKLREELEALKCLRSNHASGILPRSQQPLLRSSQLRAE